jgi:hypothetical protein
MPLRNRLLDLFDQVYRAWNRSIEPAPMRVCVHNQISSLSMEQLEKRNQVRLLVDDEPVRHDRSEGVHVQEVPLGRRKDRHATRSHRAAARQHSFDGRAAMF